MPSKSLSHGIALAAALLIGAACIKYAQHHHLLSGSAAERGSQVITGLILAIYANFIPKRPRVAPGSAPTERMRPTLRLTGGAFAVAGLAYAGLWAFAPMDVAFPLSIVVMAGAIAVSLGYCLWARRPTAHA